MEERVHTTAKGRRLEDEVADIYRQLDGVRQVKQNVSIMGVQVDIWVVMESRDGILSRYAIDAKNYETDVPSREMRECITNFQMLRNARNIDQGIVIAKVGFAKDAQAAAQEAGVHTLTIKDLRRRVSGFTDYLTDWIALYSESDFVKHGLYIPLSATTDDGDSAGRVEEYVASWLADEGNLITILGNYGTGKSTTLRRIMWYQAQRHLANPDTERIPIFVDLKRFRQAPTAQALITDLLVNQSDVAINYRRFAELNAKGRFLILFDGFDEMAERVLDGMPLEHFNELAQLATDGAKVIISSRTHYFRDHEEVLRAHSGETELFQEIKTREGFQILFLDPFSKKDVETYLRRRFKEDWADYKRVIDDTYDLASLAEVPILLSMIVQALPKLIARGGTINRSAIYRTFTDQWLHRDQWRRGLHVEERRYFCRSLAIHFYRTQQNRVHWKGLPGLVKQYLGQRTIDSLDDLDVFSTDVRTSNFLIRDDAGYYSFVHKSFMEFFVAEHYVESIRTQIADRLESLRDPSRSPVIWEFLFEMLQPDDVDLLRQDLYKLEKGADMAELAANRLEGSRRTYSGPASLGNIATILIHGNLPLAGAQLEQARMDSLRLSSCDFSRAMLYGASFVGTILDGVSFQRAVLAYADFGGATLRNCDFSHANLERANLLTAQIDKATLDTMALSKHWGSVQMKPLYKARVKRRYHEPVAGNSDENSKSNT